MASWQTIFVPVTPCCYKHLTGAPKEQVAQWM